MEEATLERARAGDERAFGDLTGPYRRELQVHCYRMLGSLTDAEDLVQETLLAAWRALPGFERRSSVRSWLYRIATNRCLNSIRDAKRRPLPEPVPPFVPPEPTARGEITWLQPYPDALLDGIPDTAPGPEARYQSGESIELAFIAALQRMPGRQVAALLLCDVLGFRMAEAADLLDTSHTSVKGMLQRARAAVEHGSPARPRAAPDRQSRVARRFAEAYLAADLHRVLALLTEDAWLSMPPAPHQYHGHEAIAAFLRVSFGYRGDRRFAMRPVAANGQHGFASYLAEPAAGPTRPSGMLVLTVAGDRIAAITRFHVDALYPRFGLPTDLPAGGGDRRTGDHPLLISAVPKVGRRQRSHAPSVRHV